MAQDYPTDLADAEWQILEPLIPGPKPRGTPLTTDLRGVVNAIFYLLRSGGQWRMLPKDYPPYQTVYGSFRDWRLTGVWERLHDALRGEVREAAGRNRLPRAGILDSQTVETTEPGGVRGYDGGKKMRGRTRHRVVDALGLLLILQVHSRDSGPGGRQTGSGSRVDEVSSLGIDLGRWGLGGPAGELSGHAPSAGACDCEAAPPKRL